MEKDYLENPTNRLDKHVTEIAAMTDVDDMMTAIIEILSETTQIPDVGKYYTFIYDPKTYRIKYDQFPLIATTGLFKWGFRGMNYHWPGFRNYDWLRTIGNLHIVYPMELNDLRSIPYQNFKINN